MEHFETVRNLELGRRNSIPILHVKGTHYEVGYDTGRTFSGLISGFLHTCQALHQDFLPAYETTKGKEFYEQTLKSVSENFPQYIQEIKGIADGAVVPFHWLFLMHMDRVIIPENQCSKPNNGINGCSTICLNNSNEVILGHTEDALEDVLNHFYILSAHIVPENGPQGKWQTKEEKFTALCYAGHLPGYAMGYNSHGLVFSVNTLCANKLIPGNIPRHFLTRALLATENFTQAEQVLRDCGGCGTADGCSINMIFLKETGKKQFRNIEIAPNHKGKESLMNILTIGSGEFTCHCNKYLRLTVPELNDMIIPNSECRMETFNSFRKPHCKHDVLCMLGDRSHKEHHVFQTGYVKTIAVGIFDCNLKTWTLYADNPKSSDPIVTLALDLNF